MLKEFLEDAKAVYERIGFAVGEMINENGQVCALGACENVSYYQKWLGEEFDNEPIQWAAEKVLDNAVQELFGMGACEGELRPAAFINDNLGRKAVLDAYDYAIKLAEDAE